MKEWHGASASHLIDKVGNLRQLAMVRRIVLDEGPERGVRALAFSTGGGLDFWVLSDRSFDIGPLWWRGTPMAWQSPAGFTAPGLLDPESAGGFGFESGFSGFLVTCGLEHIRQPSRGRPLHGHFPFTPGQLLSYGEDWNGLIPMLFCEGEVVQARGNSGSYRLRRRIEAPIGGNVVSIHDTVENCGLGDQELALLYHINFGFPLVGNGTQVLRGSKDLIDVPDSPESGAEPSIACFDARKMERSQCAIVRGDLRADISFDCQTLPWLQLWCDPRPRRRVLAIEPATSERLSDGTSGPGPSLESGDTKEFCLEASFGCG